MNRNPATKLIQNLNQILEKRKQWKRQLGLLAVVVTLATTYALTRPAITMENPDCGKAEHVHTDECYYDMTQLTCGMEETPSHVHTQDCYDENGNLICGKEEDPGHIHTDECYTTTRSLICGKEEHIHTADCYPPPTTEDAQEPPALSDDMSLPQAPANTSPGTPQTGMLGDPDADVETATDWEDTFSHVELTGNWAKDVLAIAETQLGYRESTRNFYMDINGHRKGYTRYGAWYGDHYGDWCAMFCSFCLHYAEVDRELMPIGAYCPRWIEILDDIDRFQGADYTPKPGDLVFFDYQQDGVSGHVGLVYDLLCDEDDTPETLITIEGNQGDCVKKAQYDLKDEAIIGYGVLPENPHPPQEILPKQDQGLADIHPDETPQEDIQLIAQAEGGVTVTLIAPTVAFSAPAEELSLAVTAIQDQAAKELIEAEAAATDHAAVKRKTVLFDIKVMYGGEEIQPEGAVSVTFSGIETPKDDEQVFHVDAEKETVEKIETTTAENGDISVETDHFSIYGVTFTVDFHYGDYAFSILGKSEILLSELFTNLNMDLSAADVTNAVFSDPELVFVEQTAGDWKLKSLKAFNTEETLTLTFEDGSELVIEVTDAPVNGVGENYVPNTAEVTALNISKVTGTAPWDSDNDPGNDQDATNDVVRSFDTIFYNVGYTLNLIDKYQGLFSGYKKAKLYVEVTLPLPKEQAGFDLDAIPWLTDAQVIDNGTSQTLTGYYHMEAANFDYVVPSTGTVRFAVSVKAMANGASVQPTFELWLDDGNNTNHASTPAEVVTPSVTTVSAKAAYDVDIKEASFLLDGSYGAQRAGLVSLAVSVRVCSNASDKGMRGFYIDADEVSFTLRAAYRGVGVSGTTASPAATTYTPPHHRLFTHKERRSDRRCARQGHGRHHGRR